MPRSTRRNFIRISSLAAISLTSSIKALANILNLPPEEIEQLIHFGGKFRRREDMLDLEFYFINAVPKGRGFKKFSRKEIEEYIKDKGLPYNVMVKRDKDKSAYMIVKLPPMHVTEEMLPNENPNTAAPPELDSFFNDQNKTVKSYVSGPSFLSFELNFSQSRELPYDIAELLDWNKHRLITLSDFTDPIIKDLEYDHSSGEYPIKEPENARLKTSQNVPVSYFELPYKIYLSPVVPFNFDLGFKPTTPLPVWKNIGNQAIKTFDAAGNQTGHELWNNRLKIEINTPTGEFEFDPEFRIVGFANETQLRESIKAEEANRKLLPKGRLAAQTDLTDQRKKLARLSNLNDKLGNRNTTSSLFIPTALGATSKLKYDNPSQKEHKIVNWEHQTSLGRDQFVRIVTEGILHPSTTKVLIVEIGIRKTRKNAQGKSISYMEYYKVIETLEKVKEFGGDYVSAYFPNEQRHRNVPIKKIEVLTPKSDPFLDQHNINLVATANRIYYPRPGGQNPAKFQFRVTDHNDNEIEFSNEIAVITEDGFEKDVAVKDTIDKFQADIEFNWLGNTTSLADGKTLAGYSTINLNKSKISFANKKKEVDGSLVNDPITELETKSLQLTFELGIDKNFKSKYPVYPILKVADTFLPVLKDLNPAASATAVTYARSFTKSGFDAQENPTQIFLNHVKKDTTGNRLNYVQTAYADPFGANSSPASQTLLKGVPSNNLKRIGVAVNPTLPIKSVSVLEQSITLAEEMNSKYSEVSSMNPADIFREAKDAKILGGIKIVDILKELIPIEDTPLFQSVKDFSEKLRQFKEEVIDNIRDLKGEIQTIENELKNIPLDLEVILVESFIKLEAQLKEHVDLFKEELVKAKDHINDALEAKIVEYLDLCISAINTLTKLSPESFELKADLQATVLLPDSAEYRQLSKELDLILTEIENKRKLVLKDFDGLTSTVRNNIAELIRYIETDIVINVFNEYYRKKQLFQSMYNQLREKIREDLDDYIAEVRLHEQAVKDKIKLVKEKVAEIQSKEKELKQKLEELANGSDVQEEIKLIKSEIAKFNSDLNKVQGEIKAIEDGIIAKKEAFENFFNKTRKEKEAKLKQIRDDIRSLEQSIRGDIQNVVAQTKNRLTAKRKELERAINDQIIDKETIQKIKDEIENTKAQLQWLQLPSNISAKYDWSTEEFSKLGFGPVKFIPSDSPKTRFDVKVNSEINFDVPSIDFDNLTVSDLKPPTIKSISYSAENKLRNFKIRFLEIVVIDFNEVSFVAGSNKKSDFDVKIQDVQFAGSLSFVEAIQDYLSTLGNGFRINITPQGVAIGYSLAIPTISAGAFTFMNGKLIFDFVIPFSGGPVQLRFCLSERHQKFIIAVGIFGGGGFFCMTLNPKDGLTELEASLEFGAFLGINLGVARGHVYLFAGIYYKKRKIAPANEQYWGYIIAGGAMSLLGLITVSLVFYMGLENRGSHVQGRASVTYAFKIVFKEFEVTATMYKRLSNAKSGGNQNKEVELRRDDEGQFQPFVLSEEEDDEILRATTQKRIKRSSWKAYINSFE